MKVILTENIHKLGSKGDIINVKRGFARNYLVPRNYAIYATPLNIKKQEVLKKQFADEDSKQFEYFKQIGDKISGLKLVFVRKVDEHDNLYGSVSEMDILNELKNLDIDISKTAIHMEKHIKHLGDFEVPIKLHKDISVALHGFIEKEVSEREKSALNEVVDIEQQIPKSETNVENDVSLSSAADSEQVTVQEEA